MKRGEGNFEDFVDDLSQQDQQFIQVSGGHHLMHLCDKSYFTSFFF